METNQAAAEEAAANTPEMGEVESPIEAEGTTEGGERHRVSRRQRGRRPTK